MSRSPIPSRTSSIRRAALALVALGALALSPAAAAAKSFSGLVPDIGAHHTLALRAVGSGPLAAGRLAAGAPAGGATAHAATVALPYGGGPVMSFNRTYVLFWQPSGSGLSYDPGYMQLTTRFLSDVAAASHSTSNVYGLTGQYHDSNGPAAYASIYGGAVLDTDPLPANGCVEPPVTGPGWTDCLNDSQYESELLKEIHANRLPTGLNVVYFIITPNGLGSCEESGPDNCALGGSASGSYCGYHSSTPDNEVLYAVIPYNAIDGHCQSDLPRPNGQTADATLSTLSHEHNETVTDPLGNAWVDSQGNEDGDLCIDSFGPNVGGSGQSAWNQVINTGHYYLQNEYSDLDGGCRPTARPDTAAIALQTKSGRRLTATGRGSSPGASIAVFDWYFGDGSYGRGRIVNHRFKKPGRYLVVLRATDSNANFGYATRYVTVRP